VGVPQRKPITKDVLERAIAAEEEAAHREHQVREAPEHGSPSGEHLQW
jgi:hypothetical protein